MDLLRRTRVRGLKVLLKLTSDGVGEVAIGVSRNRAFVPDVLAILVPQCAEAFLRFALAATVSGAAGIDAPVRGITISTHRGGQDWGSDRMPEALAAIRTLGANWVAIHPYARVGGDGSVRTRYSGATPGRMRVSDDGDLDLLVKWMLCFNRDVGMHSHPMDVLRPQVAQRIARQGLYIWEDGGQPVSVAGPSRPTAHGMAINAVYTPPELRGRGYATACVAALSQLVLDSGKEFCTLFADKTNPTSNSIYQRIGYEPVGSFTEYVFED